MMKITLTLLECETETLVQMSINHPWPDARTRAAGMLMLGSKEHPTAIARKLGGSHQSIYNWRHDWEAWGIRVAGPERCRTKYSRQRWPLRAPKL